MRHMDSVKEAGETTYAFNTERGWQEVRRGLGHVLLGLLVLAWGAGMALLLTWLADRDGRIAVVYEAGFEKHDVSTAVGLITAASVLAGFLLIVAGLGRCLAQAPRRHGARQLLAISTACVLLGTLSQAGGVLLGGAGNYLALRQGLSAFDRLELLRGGGLLQSLGLTLGLFAALSFCQFLRTVVGCFEDRPRARKVDLFLASVGLLVGASIGVVLCRQQLPYQEEILLGLGAGWLVCFLLHLLLIADVRECITEGVLRCAAREPLLPANYVPLRTAAAFYGWRAGGNP